MTERRITSAGWACARHDREPLLIDWRAPAAAAFYRATSGEPMGVVRRRGASSAAGPRSWTSTTTCWTRITADDLRVLGEGALLAALRRSRGAPHARHRDHHPAGAGRGDPGARAGGHADHRRPGTGKTQVALHRAAYLLYTDRGRFTDGRILVVGPSTVFTTLHQPGAARRSARRACTCARSANSSTA
jgi:hypothetical protein